jgi:hypothetical protein
MELAMAERRRDLRQRTYKAARISFNDKRAAIDCVVKNLSAQGACLQVASPIGIPDAFDLVFDSDHSARPCQVIWRKERQIGVEFR